MKIKLLKQLIIALRSMVIIILMLVTFTSTSFSAITKVQSVEDVYVSIEINKASLGEVFKSIENQTDFRFIYDAEVLKTKRRLTLYFKNETLKEVLKDVSNELSLNFKQINRNIFVKEAVFAENKNIQQEKIRFISGQVNDKNGNPLPGVSVVIKESTIGTATDIDGNFNISVSASNDVLVFSFLGMLTQEITILNKNIVDVEMIENHTILNEIVAIGYGVQKKSDLTGSIASVKADEIAKLSTGRVDQAIQGKIAGVHISNSKATPGASPVIRIRGGNSINGNNSPLVVIDGVLDADMSILSPSDVSSIEILKDASATAIYGSRGANGVLLITTKSGCQGKTRFSFNSHYSISEVSNTLDLLNAEETKSLYEGFSDDLKSRLGVSDINFNTTADTDWQDEIFRTAVTKDYHLSVSGGSENIIYSISGSLLDQDGIIKGSAYERQTLRCKFSQDVSDKLSFGINLNIAHSIQDQLRMDTSGGSSGGSVTQAAHRMSPLVPVYDSKGAYSDPLVSGAQLNNPVALVKERIRETDLFATEAKIDFTYNIIPDLKLMSSYSFRQHQSQLNSWSSGVLLESKGQGAASIGNRRTKDWLSETILTFNKTLGRKHQLTTMLGFTVSEFNNFSSTASGKDFPTESLTYYSLELSDVNYQRVNSSYLESSMSSFLGRVNYVFDNKYLFTANFRADGASKFTDNHKWGYFPSLAIGWRLSEESFLKDSDLLSNLKLRMSIGNSGSQAISAYQSIANYRLLSVSLGDGDHIGVLPDRINNPDLKWETTTQTNVGIDLGFLNNRISIVADYYYKRTKDLHYEKQLPNYTGYTVQLQNIGEIENKGFELAVKTVNINGDFKWMTDFNFSTNKNKVINLGGDEFFTVDGSGGAMPSGFSETGIIEVGKQLGQFYGYEFDGIYQNDAEVKNLPASGAVPGSVKYKDINGDHKITADDRVVVGNANPDFTWGISNSFSYKGFDLDVLFTGVQGNDILNLNRVALEKTASANNVLKSVINCWHGEGTSNTIQARGMSVGQMSSRFVEDGSFIRLKNLSLGYTFPEKLIRKFKVEKLRIYFSAQNLITITDYTGYDPEINSRSGNVLLGYDFGGYPTARTFSAGIGINF